MAAHHWYASQSNPVYSQYSNLHGKIFFPFSPTCNKNASNNCWNTHLGWCPTHQVVFAFEADSNGTNASTGPACPTCLNVEWQATEAYSHAQADSMAASQALKKATSELAWTTKNPGKFGATSAAELLLAVESTETKLANCETRRRQAYSALSSAVAARKASQARYKA